MRTRLALVMHTFNEDKFLRKALESASGVDEIVVSDSGSTDQTLKLLNEYEAKVLHVVNNGAEPDRESAIRAAKSEWCLVLDPDESLSDGAVQAIHELIESSPSDVSAYAISFRSFIGERQIYATGWDADRYEFHTRLFRREDVLWRRAPSSDLLFAGRVIQLDPESNISINHAIFDNISHVFSKFDAAATAEAEKIIQRDEVPSPIRGFRSGLEEFVRRYSPEEDGILSWVLSYAHMHKRFAAHAKALEQQNWESTEPIPSREAAIAAWNAFWRTLVSQTIAEERTRISTKLEADRNVEDAISSLRRLLSSWGEDAGLLSDLATLEHSLGFDDAALVHIRRAVAIDPSDVVAVESLTSILQSAGKS